MATYLITQANGTQSRTVIRHLLAASPDNKIHAVVRNPDSIPEEMKDPRIIVFKGESIHSEEVLVAARGCKAAFLNTYNFPGLEVRQARGVIEACKTAGIDQIVASTTFYANHLDTWDNAETKEIGMHWYFEAKHNVEEIVKSSGFKYYTILRPAFISTDYLNPLVHQNYPELATHATLVHSFDHGVRMPHTDVDDIGKYAAAAFKNPEKFNGESIDLFRDAHTPEEARDILSRVSGRQIKVYKRTPEEVEEAKKTPGFQMFILWVNLNHPLIKHTPYEETLKKFGIPFTGLEDTMIRRKKSLLEVLPQ